MCAHLSAGLRRSRDRCGDSLMIQAHDGTENVLAFVGSNRSHNLLDRESTPAPSISDCPLPLFGGA
jgi:hypothetical protein